ncbi:AraC family transcriptional regulator [Thalassotalea sp. PS06]|uniref:AraC family transcriptional regulator n=1 Tax=Thalassotalea sp. PS06 TaxID=2594005 RepID=UPI001162FC58|nr:AraC family transcriptional regulator [Thalassotalea sp. PS06]QDO99925.1 AraC family transcriptional regulator [Thalassotalea sp. PS06]
MLKFATTNAEQLWAFTRYMYLAGIDVSHYLHECELPDSLLYKGDIKISTHLVYQFVEQVAQAEGITNIGWKSGLKSGYKGLRGLAELAVKEKSLKQCLKLIPRLTYTGASHADFFMLTRNHRVEFCHIGGVVKYYPGYYQVESYLVMVLLDIIHHFVPANFVPTQIRLRSPKPEDWQQQFDDLLEAAETLSDMRRFNLNRDLITFDNPHTAIEFSSHYLSCLRHPSMITTKPATESNSTAISGLVDQGEIVTKAAKESTADSDMQALNAPVCRKSYPDLANLIDILLPYFGQQMPSLDSVALMGHTSPRNLQRSLKSRGLTLTLLVQQIRQELAVKLLMKGDSVQDIARQLGYQHSTHFIRTFKQLSGITPKQFQKNPHHPLPVITDVTHSIMEQTRFPGSNV